MQISSTHRPHAQRTAVREPLTAKGKLDQQLAEGVQDVVDLGTSRAEVGKSNVYRDFGFTTLHHGVLGGALGLAMGNMSPVGGLVGLGVGTYIAFNKTVRKDSGTVQVDLDGQTRKTHYFGRPENYVQTPQEVRAEMIASGQLGERIGVFAPPESEGGAPSSFSAKEQQALKNLAGEKRLVADFGQKSEYGYEVLNPVDSLTAARLMESGKEVFLVTGSSKDTKHSLDVVASNNRSTVRKHHSSSYLERTYDYTLTPLEKEQLETSPQGEGLPEGFHGVYKNHLLTSLVMGEDDQAGMGVTDKDYNKTSFDYRRVTRDQNIDMGSQEKARVITTASVNVRDLVTMVGVLAGMVTGMSVSPGVPTAVLLGGAVGGVAGRELGWLAQDHMPTFRTS